jgi:hypothetical protein
MYYALGAFVKPSFGTAGSEARATGKRFSVKYSLILLSAFLVVGCGGITEEQLATPYQLAADKNDAAIASAETDYESAMAMAATEIEQLQALADLYSAYAGSDRIFADEIAAIQWTPELVSASEQLITCIDDSYLLQLEVVMSEDLQEALGLADSADDKSTTCTVLAQELGKSLGLQVSPN